LRKHLGRLDADNLTERTIDRYIRERLKKVSRATVNRETQPLGQALKLAKRKKLISSIPYIERFREDNARQGFFEAHEFDALVSFLPDYLKDFVRFAYFSGWRKGEISALEWRDVQGNTIRLRPEISKTHEGRVLLLVGELEDIIGRRREQRHELQP
jgi:integrase